jgi:hypothetical protein
MILCLRVETYLASKICTMFQLFRKYFALATFCCATSLFAQTQLGIDIDCEARGDINGGAVSMPDLNTVGIGAYRNDGGGNSSGHVRIRRWNGSAWVPKGNDIDGSYAEEGIGWAVSMPDANTVGIGCVAGGGDVRVYAWDGIEWVQKGLSFTPEDDYGWNGYAVSMPDANTIAMGSPHNDGGGADAGSVRVYTWDGLQWVQKGGDLDGEFPDDYSGAALSMPDANTVAIGAEFNGGTGPFSGHTRIYAWNGIAWVQKGADIDGEAAYDHFGYAVSMPDSNTVAIGAKDNDGTASNAGHVRIYGWNGTAWVQKGADIDGEAQDDHSGYAVSMAGANIVAIGAIWNNGSGLKAGQVRIYSWNGSAWVQNGADIDGELPEGNLGYAVSMGDGNTVAVGAPNNNYRGPGSGHVRVYATSVLGTDEAKASETFSVYPNPISASAGQKQLTLDFKQGQRNLMVRIETLTGQLLYETRHAFADHIAITVDAEPGIYLLRTMASGHSLGNVKLIVQ